MRDNGGVRTAEPYARALTTIALWVMAASIPATPLRADDRSHERLYRLIESDWESLKQRAPAVAQLAGDWRWMNAWPDLSPGSIRAMQEQDRHRLRELRRIDVPSLSAAERLHYRLFERELRNRQRQYAAKAYLTHFWQFDLFAPSALNLLAFVATEPPLKETEQVRARVQRLKAFPHYADQQIALMREAVSAKMLPPAALVEGTIRSLEAELRVPAEKSTFYRSFSEAASAGGPLRGAGTAQLEAARQAIDSVVKPAIQRLIAFLSDEYLKLCPAEVSLSRWPHGAEFYRLLVDFSTTTTLTPEAIHQTGIAEVARIQARIEATVRATGYSGTVDDFVASLRSDKRFYFSTEEELLAAYRSTAQRAASRVFGLFRSKPPDPPHIMARRMGPTGPSAAYGRGSTILVNVSNPEMRPKFEMLAVMLHEGVPGHHLQKSFEVAQRAERRAGAALQRLRHSDAFVEGWGLYAETLGSDAGLYEDPYDRFGQLTYELMRAARMVVDTGMHSRGWSREEAIRYFRGITGKPLAVAEGEIERAVSEPGSLVAYKVGELALQNMRRQAKAVAGERFDVRDFHEFVLRNGPLPLDLLEVEFREWLKSGVTAPSPRN